MECERRSWKGPRQREIVGGHTPGVGDELECHVDALPLAAAQAAPLGVADDCVPLREGRDRQRG